MKKEYITTPILFGISFAIGYLFFLMWRPFFIPIAWAAVFAILFSPLNIKLRKRIQNRAWGATIMTALVILILVVPMVTLGILLVAEVVNTYNLIQQWFNSQVYGQIVHFFQGPFLAQLQDRIGNIIDLKSIDLFSIISSVMQRLSRFAVSQATDIVQNFSRTLFSFILMLFTLFYFFKDGDHITQFIRGLLPLSPDRREQIGRQFSEVIIATVVGDLMVASLQGILGGLAFWVLGIPSPVFWGALMAFLSILPVVGAPIVYIPAGIILLAQNQVVRGVILLIWGTLVVSQIDNFLRPILISGRTKLHTLVLFFSILGGIYIFGFLGIVMGPVIAALLLTVLQIYREEVVKEEKPPDLSADSDSVETSTTGE